METKDPAQVRPPSLAQCTEYAHTTYHAFRRGGEKAFNQCCEEEIPRIFGKPKDSEVEPDGDHTT